MAEEPSNNPFLIRPGSTPPPESPEADDPAAPVPPTAPLISRPVAAAAGDGPVVESGTRRIVPPRVPAGPPIAAPPSATSPPPQAASPAERAPATAPTPVPPGPDAAHPGAWRLVTAEGREVDIGTAVLVGRNPAHPAHHPSALLVAVDDPQKTVSKTHAVFEVRGESVVVRDLSSTNGTTVETTAGPVLLAAGDERVLDSGTTVLLGSYAVRIDRLR